MNTRSASDYDLGLLEELTSDQLCKLDWKALPCFTGQLLDLHAEGALGNEEFAKLPRRPILCIDKIDVLNEERIEATFRFPDQASEWSFDINESLEMLFQDQMDQLVGFWGARKAMALAGHCPPDHVICISHSISNLASGCATRWKNANG